MRNSIALLIAVSLASKISVDCAADDSPAEFPTEWRVVVETRHVYEFAHQLTMELNSKGELVETTRERKTDPKTTRRNVDLQTANQGLHLVWTVLEDTSLFGGRVEDGDMVKVSLETKHWTWTRRCSTDNQLKAADERLPLFVDLMRGKPIDQSQFRTKHGPAGGKQDRWKTKWDRGDRNGFHSGSGGGSLTFGQEDYSFEPIPSGWRFRRWKGSRFQEKFDLATDALPALSLDQLIGVLHEFREQCSDRSPTGDQNFAISLTCGGTTTLQLRGFKNYAEIGPLSEALFLNVKSVLPKEKISK